jgi:transcriptional regulator with XRE-family HTH domain
MTDWTPHDDGEALVRRGKVAIGAAVRSGRMSLMASQRALAERAGISQSVISRLETGHLNGIRWQTLARVVGLLDAAGAFPLATRAQGDHPRRDRGA